MKRLGAIIAISIIGLASPAFAASDLTIKVENELGVPLPNAEVYALTFQGGGSSSDHRVSSTGASGFAHFIGGNSLANSKDYEIFVGLQGYQRRNTEVPGIIGQFHSFDHLHIVTSGVFAGTHTIVMSSATVSDKGQIDVWVQGASPNLVISADIRRYGSNYQEPVQQGWGLMSGAGAGVIKIFNVPYESTGTYNADSYDPVLNKGAGGPKIAFGLGDYRTYISSTEVGALDISGGIPPRNVESSGGGSNDNSFGLSVEGVVVSTDASETPVPHAHVSLTYFANDPYCPGCKRGTGGSSDQNGRFQLFGLEAGATYYAQVFGSCHQSGCFEGWSSTYTFYTPSTSAPTGRNDFFYASSSTVLTQKMRLDRASGGSGVMNVYVKDQNGVAIPQAWVSVHADGMQYEKTAAEGGDNSCATSNDRVSRSGLAQQNLNAATGYALIENLPAGNYQLQAHTPFGGGGGAPPSFNAGADGELEHDPSQKCGSDDFRLYVSTWQSPNLLIYNSSGVLVAQQSSVTVVVPAINNGSGRVRGTLTFPSNLGTIDLRNDPISITLWPQCDGGDCSGGGFMAITGVLAGNTTTYDIAVSSGRSFYMSVRSNFWGVVRTGGGDDQVNLISTGTWVKDMKFDRAGRVSGKIYKPDGSLLTPQRTSQNSYNVEIVAKGKTTESYGWTQGADDGSYLIGGLLPGTYDMDLRAWGASFPYASPNPKPEIRVTAGADTYRDINAETGVTVIMNLSTGALPGIPNYTCAQGSHDCPPESNQIKGLPAGTPFSLDTIHELMVHNSNDNEWKFSHSTYTPGNGNSGCRDFPNTQPMWCPQRVASPQNFDLYALRRGDFDDDGTGNVRPYIVVYFSSKNVVLSSQKADTQLYLGYSTATVQTVNLTAPAGLGTQGQATITGNVVAQNIIRQADFDSFGGNMNNFIKYIPLLSLYDENNALRASGLVIPPPTFFGAPMTINSVTKIADDWFEESLAAGDYNLFKTVFLNAPSFGFEIRGLKPLQTYTAVLTTPNYPHYTTKVTLGIDASTTTLNINLDQAVGAGAILSGTITSTNSVTLGNASVTIEAESYKKRTQVTGSTGVYKFEGLPPGTYKVSVSASGYALGQAQVDVSGTSTFTQNISLRVAGSRISGTVYTQKVPFQKLASDAEVFAYNDTLNIASPLGELPLYKTVTSSIGFYTLEGLEVGQVYKLFVKFPSKFIATTSTLTIVGERAGVDIVMVSKPLNIEVFGTNTGSDYEFTIVNPNDFKDGDAWISESPFNLAASTNVGNEFMELPNQQLLLRVPLDLLDATKEYVLHIEAISFKGQKVTKEVLFGSRRPGYALQAIDDALIGDESEDEQGKKGNQASLDNSGSNASALSFPPGALISASTGSIPSCSFSEVDVNASTVSAIVNVLTSTLPFASGIYQLDLSSVSLTERGFDLTLAYDKSNSDVSDLAIHHFNSGTQKWEQIAGLQTIDPVKGTITVKKIKSLASILSLKRNSPMKAMVVGGEYVPQDTLAALASSDSGSFAVLKPSLVGSAYTGGTIKVYNFPNPFSLASKSVTAVNGSGGPTTVTTNGTVIKYEVPTNISGQAYIRIYTLNGELVREMDQGNVSGGFYYYAAWDGKNKNGKDVANGVYYGILSIPGAKTKDTTFKMAVIK